MIKKTENNLMILAALFSTSLVIANVLNARLFVTGLELFNSSIILPGACICYALTYLITDIVGEIWNKETANKFVFIGIICQIFATILIIITGFFPTTEEIETAYQTLLGQNVIFVIASLTAYYISQTIDVKLFHFFKHKFKAKWIRNNFSTMTSQFFDTIIFITIGYGIGFKWLLDRQMLPTLLIMILCEYVFKFILALCDTPIFYLCTSKTKHTKKTNLKEEISLIS